MFTRYNINDLFLAYVVVNVPSKNSESAYTTYGYPTILTKKGEIYIDLQNKDRVITNSLIPNQKSYVIYEIEPLSKHYTQDGRRINTFSRKKALNAEKQYNYVISHKIIERTKAI